MRLDRQDPDRLHAVAEVAVRAPGDGPSTIEAFARLGMRDALENAGYPVLADAAAEARG